MSLLPEYGDPTAQQGVLAESWPALFEAMLAGRATDETLWPKIRTLGMFREWLWLHHVLYRDSEAIWEKAIEKYLLPV